MHDKRVLLNRVRELEELLDIAERKTDILTNLLKEASAEFQQALEKVTVSESNFRAIFENAPEAIYILCTDTGRILDCNSFASRWLGFSRSELLGMRVGDILASGTAEIEENIEGVGLDGAVRVLEGRFRKKDGSVVDAEVTGTLIEYEGERRMVALARDITERKTLEEMARYKELFANVSDPVFINDSRGRFLEVNAVACDCFGYSRRKLLEMAIKNLVSPGQNRLLSEMGTRIEGGETVTFELEMTTRKGRNIPFEFHAKSVRFLGKKAVLSVARDLSVRKRMEETLVKTERLSALGEMASGVAHNYNNLLQMIMASGEAALSKMGAGKMREATEAVETILDAARRGADTVKRIKDFTDIRSGQVAQKAPFDIGDLLEEAVELTKPLWKNPQNPGKYRMMFQKPRCMLDGNASEIYEVLINLIKNAVEAMPGGGTIRVFTEYEGDFLAIRIADAGMGIADENLERIFEPFFTTKGTKSSGLGLSSSYGIVKRNQGDMRVASKPGEGTCFSVFLPLSGQCPLQTESEKALPDHAKIRFLLIDDEINILKAMEMFFEDTEIELVTAEKAADGLDYLREKDFDVVLCDLGMDDMDGWTVGRKVRELFEERGERKLPFILYTGLDKALDAERLVESGIDRVVTKPVSCEKLQKIVHRVVADSRKP